MPTRYYILSIILVFLSYGVNAQLVNWSVQHSTADQDHEANPAGAHLAVNSQNEVYSVGIFFDTVDFDLGPGIAEFVGESSTDSYITKRNSNGDLIWAKEFDGSGWFDITDMELDQDENILLVGYYAYGMDFDPGVGTNILTSDNYENTVILKLDTAGNLIWLSEIGIDSQNIQSFGITTDTSNSVIVTGVFSDSVDFDPGTGQFIADATGHALTFVLKLDENGDFIWVRHMQPLASYNFTRGLDIATDVDGGIYTVGRFNGTIDFNPDNLDIDSIAPVGWRNIFVWKLDANGNFEWANGYGSPGTNDCIGKEVEVDSNKNVYLTGGFAGNVDWDPGPGVNIIGSGAGLGAPFLMKLHPNGGLDWIKVMPTTYLGLGIDIERDEIGNILLNGWVYGDIDLDPGAGTNTISSIQWRDGFISKYDPFGNFIWGTLLGGAGNQECSGLAFDSSGYLYNYGVSDGIFDLDPGPIVDIQHFDLLATFLQKWTICGSSYEVVQICSGEDHTFPDGSVQTNITSDVVHNSLFTLSGFCDSTVVTTIQVQPEFSISEDVFICSGDNFTYPDGTTELNLTDTTTHISSLFSLFGCDSVITTTLHPVDSFNFNVSTNICSGDDYTFPDGSLLTNITSDTIQLSHFTASGGCDSIITTNIQVSNDTTITQNISICNGDSYTFPDGSEINNVTAAGMQVSVLNTVMGCDSSIVTNYNVIDTTLNVMASGMILTASASGSSYQWINCGPPMNPIPGETGQVFIASEIGNYAVIITNSCITDTSDCYLATNVGVESINGISLRVYPNPFTSSVIIEFDSIDKIESIEIRDILGKLVKHMPISPNQKKVELDLNNQPSGIYMARIGNVKTVKLLRE